MMYTADDGQWCKVEVMGYVEHIARCKEVALLDGKALRVCDETEPGPIHYGLGAIFSLRWLSDEEGEAMAADRQLELGRRTEQRAHDTKIAAIQQTIREAIEGKKVALDPLYEAVLVRSPGVTMDDFAEAVESMGLDRWPADESHDHDLYWIDPDGNPF